MAGQLIRRRVLGTGGGRFGGSANYTDFDQNGYMTAASTGRVLKEVMLQARDFNQSGSDGFALTGSLYFQPGAVAGRNFHYSTWSPCSTTCDMKLNSFLVAPQDVASSGSIIPTIELIVNTNVTTASGLGVTIYYNFINNAACSTTAGSVQAVCATTASLGVGGRVSASLPSLPSFGGAGQLVGLMVQFLTGACGAGVNFDFAALRLKYVSDRLGQQSS